MKKILLSGIAIALIASFAIYAQIRKNRIDEDPQLAKWEKDEEAAIVYLSKAADAGNAQAALFCGSACRNQGKGDDAFKYLTKAYELGCPVPAGILRCAIRRASAHLSIATKP